MAKCSYLCFPLRVVRSLSKKDRSLYVLFHILLWLGLIAFFTCLSVYAALRDYMYFIIPLPSAFLIFIGLFGFRWLAIRNNDKFELDDERHQRSGSLQRRHQHVARASSRTGVNASGVAEAGIQSGCCPPPPVYALEYDGPIFTIYGSLVPPPTYEEAQEVAAATATEVVVETSSSTPAVGGETPIREGFTS